MTAPPPPPERNRRLAPRRAIRQPATVVYGDIGKPVQTWDLGQEGMCFVAARPIPPGTRCRIAFDLAFDGAVTPVAVAAKVVYSSYSAAGEFKIGAVFTDLAEDVGLLLGKFAAGA